MLESHGMNNVSTKQSIKLSRTLCRRARLSRDHRFDGLFFTAVKTTGIYCRSICPANPPLEKNVDYYDTAVAAALAGFRPCLRCRPDSAPGSPAWLGSKTTLRRATRLIHEGALIEHDMNRLAQRLGVTDRYLRKLFQAELGLSPKSYSLYYQCLLAKKLLHETRLPITQVAFASGFNSIRRFNDCFKKQFRLAPRQIRSLTTSNYVRNKQNDSAHQATVSITLAYRPPYDWAGVHEFFRQRLIDGLEWLDDQAYGRTFQLSGHRGRFTAQHDAVHHRFNVTVSLDEVGILAQAIANIRRCLDVDAVPTAITTAVAKSMPDRVVVKGLRLPGVWSPFEAGVRAILGQQISVKAAKKLVTQLITMNSTDCVEGVYFPTPQQLLALDLNQLGMPQRRRASVLALAEFAIENPLDEPEPMLALPGIGPWTVNYIRMRGCSDPDIFLGDDLGIKKAIRQQVCRPELAVPWRSYLTLSLWSALK